jgi:uncharacterized membrane-anchored protein
MRGLLMWLAGLFVLGSFGFMIAQKEVLLRNGQTVYLALQPVDPRSLMQGDYMALNYAIMNTLNHDHFDTNAPKPLPSGQIVIKLDDRNVGTFARYDKNQPPGAGEHWLKYHHDGWRAVIGAESYFIPEGSGQTYAKAAYAELKLEPDGSPLMVALCDGDLHRIAAQHDAAR